MMKDSGTSIYTVVIKVGSIRACYPWASREGKGDARYYSGGSSGGSARVSTLNGRVTSQSA
jgi:hypothetical protein